MNDVTLSEFEFFVNLGGDGGVSDSRCNVGGIGRLCLWWCSSCRCVGRCSDVIVVMLWKWRHGGGGGGVGVSRGCFRRGIFQLKDMCDREYATIVVTLTVVPILVYFMCANN